MSNTTIEAITDEQITYRLGVYLVCVRQTEQGYRVEEALQGDAGWRVVGETAWRAARPDDVRHYSDRGQACDAARQHVSARYRRNTHPSLVRGTS